jgi:quinohemoprotein ethanol dehydrogenase
MFAPLVRSCLCFLALALSACSSDQGQVLANASTDTSWPVMGGNHTASHYSTLKEINSANVTDLGIAWVTELPVANGLVAEPIMVDGVMYVSGEFSKVFALDAASGAILWQHDPEVDLGFSLGNSWASRFNRGVAVLDDKVYVGTGDCRLIALNADKGEKLWESPVCNPAEGSGAGITGAPRVGAGLVFMGYLASDTGARGSIAAFDADTGEEVWRFWTVPGDPAAGDPESPALKAAVASWSDGWARQGGGAVWDAITYDDKTGLLYFGTAGALPLNPKTRDKENGDNLFTNSILAVDARTGAHVWHYQTVPADAWDYDAAMHILITELNIKGSSRRVVLTAPKNGFLYLLDARSGELLRADPIAKKITWASHVDVKTGRPVVLEVAKYYSNELIGQTVQVFPGANGAHNWHANSYHPRHGLLYIPMIDMPGYYTANDGLITPLSSPSRFRTPCLHSSTLP